MSYDEKKKGEKSRSNPDFLTHNAEMTRKEEAQKIEKKDLAVLKSQVDRKLLIDKQQQDKDGQGIGGMKKEDVETASQKPTPKQLLGKDHAKKRVDDAVQKTETGQTTP